MYWLPSWVTAEIEFTKSGFEAMQVLAGREHAARVVLPHARGRQVLRRLDELGDLRLGADRDERLPGDVAVDLLGREQVRHGSDALAVQDADRGVVDGLVPARRGAAGGKEGRSGHNGQHEHQSA